MALIPGSRLGIYDITAQIGEGGMGQVYRATDTKLKRQVAIKILPPSLAADADRLARFQREAEVLASLNHPNIAGIYGLEEGGGMTALVMELVEGDDLSQRIAHGAIPIDEALPLAKQIAEALEAAHEQSIIHRDLKPANIKVRADGTVKVLDFGLAKAMAPTTGSSPSLSMSPTLSMHATQAGFTAEIARQRREHLAQMAGARRELAAVERRQKEILNALSEGYRAEAWKAELVTLDEKKAALTMALAEPPLPAMHPQMAEVFRQKATTLAAGLEHDEERDAARQALRGFLDKIVIPPGDDLLQVVGNVGSMLAAAQSRSQSKYVVGNVGCGGGI